MIIFLISGLSEEIMLIVFESPLFSIVGQESLQAQLKVIFLDFYVIYIYIYIFRLKIQVGLKGKDQTTWIVTMTP